MTITEFLEARIEEDEAAARAATKGPWAHGTRQIIAGVIYSDNKCTYCSDYGEPTWTGKRNINGKRMAAHVHEKAVPRWDHGIYAQRSDGDICIANDTEEYGYIAKGDAAHIARHDPSRVLAECAAKRAILELTTEVDGMDSQIESEWGDFNGTAENILRTLAAVYASHPDYEQEWAL